MPRLTIIIEGFQGEQFDDVLSDFRDWLIANPGGLQAQADESIMGATNLPYVGKVPHQPISNVTTSALQDELAEIRVRKSKLPSNAPEYGRLGRRQNNIRCELKKRGVAFVNPGVTTPVLNGVEQHA